MFKEALTDILERLEAARRPGPLDEYMLIGGLAVGTWGVPRSTGDIDFAFVANDPASLAEAIRGTYESAGPDDPPRGVIRTDAGAADAMIRVQLVLLPSNLSRIVFADRETVHLFGLRAPIASWRSLILLKLYAGGPQDRLDAEGILTVQQPSDAELRGLEQAASALGLSQELADLIRRYASD